MSILKIHSKSATGLRVKQDDLLPHSPTISNSYSPQSKPNRAHGLTTYSHRVKLMNLANSKKSGHNCDKGYIDSNDFDDQNMEVAAVAYFRTTPKYGKQSLRKTKVRLAYREEEIDFYDLPPQSSLRTSEFVSRNDSQSHESGVEVSELESDSNIKQDSSFTCSSYDSVYSDSHGTSNGSVIDGDEDDKQLKNAHQMYKYLDDSNNDSIISDVNITNQTSLLENELQSIHQCESINAEECHKNVIKNQFDPIEKLTPNDDTLLLPPLKGEDNEDSNSTLISADKSPMSEHLDFFCTDVNSEYSVASPVQYTPHTRPPSEQNLLMNLQSLTLEKPVAYPCQPMIHNFHSVISVDHDASQYPSFMPTNNMAAMYPVNGSDHGISTQSYIHQVPNFNSPHFVTSSGVPTDLVEQDSEHFYPVLVPHSNHLAISPQVLSNFQHSPAVLNPQQQSSLHSDSASSYKIPHQSTPLNPECQEFVPRSNSCTPAIYNSFVPTVVTQKNPEFVPTMYFHPSTNIVHLSKPTLISNYASSNENVGELQCSDEKVSQNIHIQNCMTDITFGDFSVEEINAILSSTG